LFCTLNFFIMRRDGFSSIDGLHDTKLIRRILDMEGNVQSKAFGRALVMIKPIKYTKLPLVNNVD
jgi:hypothetical protein